MPINNGNVRTKRPSSPYQSRNVKNDDKARVWRSLSSNGFAHIRYPELENSKAAWLKTLRLGTGVERSAYQPVYGSRKTKDDVSLALASSSEYLKQQLGLTIRPTEVSSPRPSSGTPQYKPQEDMYDEIIELKKIIQLKKQENDQLKTKLRYNEEENVKKEKCITQLLDEAMVMHNGKFTAKSDQILVKTLKSQQMKSSHKVESLNDELKELKSKLKQLKARCRTAKSNYVDEVKKLQEAIRKQNHDIKLLSGETDSDGEGDSDDARDLKRSRFATDIKTLRTSIVKLTQENCRLKEDSKLLRKDLEQTLLTKDDDKDETKKKVSTYEEKIDRMKATIGRLKEEKSSVYEENNEKSSRVQHLIADLEDSKQEISSLKEKLEDKQQQVEIQSHRSRTPSPARRSRRSSSSEKKVEDHRQHRAARKIQTKWRNYREERDDREYESSVKLIQSSFRGHLAREECLDNNYKHRKTSKVVDRGGGYGDDDVTLLQSAMRAHNARSDMMANRNK